jgi:hypothetical protein
VCVCVSVCVCVCVCVCVHLSHIHTTHVLIHKLYSCIDSITEIRDLVRRHLYQSHEATCSTREREGRWKERGMLDETKARRKSHNNRVHAGLDEEGWCMQV